MNGTDQDPWSVTEQDLYESMRSFRADGTGAVLATVVGVEGSAYRRPGAKMLVVPGQESLGAITAGCLEGPVDDLAADVLEAGRPSVHTFDLMDDEGWGLGLGCNGIIDILLEPLGAEWEPILEELAAGRPVATTTVVGVADDVDDTADDHGVAVGDRVVTDEAGEPLLAASRGDLPESVLDAVADERERLRPQGGAGTVSVETDAGAIEVFVEWLTPAPTLLLFGTQNDVHSVARIGHEAGFRVVVASARGARSDSEQFPHAHAVRTTKPMDVAEVLDAPERTYAVIMSHNAIEDRLALASLLDTDVPYVGLMGPRDRFEDLRADMAAEDDRELTEAELDRIATPVGLDLGGGEPTQIAISIVAEALAVHNGRDGGRLKEREGPIHTRVAPSE